MASALALTQLAAAAVLATSTAVNDAYPTDEDTQLVVNAADGNGLLANDSTDAGTLCVTGFDSTGLQGSLDSAAPTDGSFSFTPTANFNGTTTFTYTVAAISGGICPVGTVESTGTVTITVNPVNDAPTAVADFFTAVKDHTLNVVTPGVLINDSDVDGDPLTAVKMNSAVHGIVILAADGSFSYTPSSGYVGPDAFSYKASDGSFQSATRVVSLNVVAIPPPPTPTPAPTPTAEVTPSPEPSPSESPAPSDSGLATPSMPADSGLSPSPSASAEPSAPVASGGLPLPALGAMALLVILLGVAGVYFVRSQRGGKDWYESGDIGGGPTDDGPFEDDEPGR